MKVLLSAFACDPTQGSELGNGWNWAVGLAKQGYEVHCLTRKVGKSNIESFGIPPGVHFHYLELPIGLEKLYSVSQPTMYLHYIAWQWLAYKKALGMHKRLNFSVCHHVTWGSVQLGSFLYKLPVPFIFGPAGGGQKSPAAFREYFGQAWDVEKKREKVSDLLLKFNPACKTMLRNAASVWVSNPDTKALVQKSGASSVQYTLDAALSKSFFPNNFEPKVSKPGVLRLLWVGRLMPRKGVLLLLDVMKKLQHLPGITLTMVGDGEQRSILVDAIKSHGLEDTVFWKGKVPFSQVKDYYHSHDAFFFTSLRDSCPAQLIEAMAYGMPVITLNLHGQAIIVNDETGFRCACDTPAEAIEALTQAILSLYNTPELLTTMSRAAHSFALKQTWDYKIQTITTTSYPLEKEQ